MQRRRLGATDVEVTPIGLGCLQFSQGAGLAGRMYAAITQDTVNAVVRAALDGGINWFDTAEMYGRGRSEQALATALKAAGAAPGEVVIATKWLPFLRTAASIERTIAARLGALQGYPIGLHQIHMPYGSRSPLAAQLRAMARLCRAGQVRSVGVSNFSARQMRLAHRVLREEGLTLAANQVRISLLHRDVERDGVLAAARELGVTLIAYSPLEGGLLTGRFHENPAALRALPRARRLLLLGGRGRRAWLARTAPLIAELRAIAAAHGATPAQVALNWLVTFYGGTVVAIPGASKPQQAADAAAAMRFQLTGRELQRLDELSRP